jgi:hypothetical protein
MLKLGTTMTRNNALRGCAAAAVTIVLSTALMSAAHAQAPNGRYECWFFGSPRGGLNFVLNGASYTGSDGASGTITGSSFKGGTNDGIRYQFKGGSPANFSILGPRGDEVSVCQRAN